MNVDEENTFPHKLSLRRRVTGATYLLLVLDTRLWNSSHVRSCGRPRSCIAQSHHVAQKQSKQWLLLKPRAQPRAADNKSALGLKMVHRPRRKDGCGHCQARFLRVAFSASVASSSLFLCLKSLTTSYQHHHRQSPCCRGPLNEPRRYGAAIAPAIEPSRRQLMY